MAGNAQSIKINEGPLLRMFSLPEQPSYTTKL